MKPRLGLLRSREFVMKDLYTFDATLDDARYTYHLVCESYNNIFKQIGVKYAKGTHCFYKYICTYTICVYKCIIIKLERLILVADYLMIIVNSYR